MPGIAQVWLTQKELEALLLNAPEKRHSVPPALWAQIEPKLVAARDSLGCPVPWSDELKAQLDWRSRDAEAVKTCGDRAREEPRGSGRRPSNPGGW